MYSFKDFPENVPDFDQVCLVDGYDCSPLCGKTAHRITDTFPHLRQIRKIKEIIAWPKLEFHPI